MSPAFYVAFYLVILGVGRWLSDGKRRELMACFEEIKSIRGGTIEEEPVGPFVNLVFGRNRPTYTLDIDELKLTIDTLPKMGTRLRVTGDLPTDISITKENSLSELGKLFGKADPEIGHGAFDSAALLDGDRTQLLSYLNWEARRSTIRA